jgi:hypothetical protein
LAIPDLIPNILKSAAAYLAQVARSSKGGRYRKSAKIDALRECKEEIWKRTGRPLARPREVIRDW